MTALSKTLLTVASSGLVGGIVIDSYYNGSINPSLTVVLPGGAIAFGLFLISLMMEKEVAVYDGEQKKKLQPSPDNAAAAEPQLKNPSQSFIAEPKENTLRKSNPQNRNAWWSLSQRARKHSFIKGETADPFAT